jgi:hypothetical protein
MKNIFKLFILILMQCFVAQNINAQASLSIQGILKKSNGVAVDDGLYTITFRLYEQETGSVSNAIWSETQSDVEVFSGIYSAVLGQSSPLNVPFDQLYYLGVTIGASELTPRILLTSAPYALSLIGATNQFPSSGKVIADSIVVNGGITVSAGVPGVSNGSGFGFTGDNDSGLFSSGDGNVSLFSNSTKVLDVDPIGAAVNGNLSISNTLNTGNVNLTSNGTINYGGLKDWRLVDIDDFTSGPDGWNQYDKLQGEHIGWNNPSGGSAPTSDFAGFAGRVLLPTSNNHVLKKAFNISGSFTQIKVKFRYYYLDSWGWGTRDAAFGAFCQNSSGTNIRISWHKFGNSANNNNGKFTSPFVQQANFYGTAGWIDEFDTVEMTAKADGSSFWVYIGSALDEDTNNETYAVGAVEVWVR